MPICARKVVHCGLGVVLGALAAAALAQPNQAESGSALPDILGIRPGMAIADAYRVLKAHDPKGSLQYGQKRIEAISDKPVTHAFLYSPTASPQDPEIILVDLTFPPSQQTVWRVSRFLRFPSGKEPLPATFVSALRQKYGQELPSRIPQLAFWVFDEQGRPAGGHAGIDLVDCAMYVDRPGPPSVLGQNTGVSNALNVPPGVALNPTVVVANREACYPFVYVTATLVADGANGVMTATTVTVTDLGAGIRAGTATRNLMDQRAAAQQQRELEKARRQPVPAF